MFSALSIEQTRLFCDFEHQLAEALLIGKACPSTWTQYCSSAIALGEPEDAEVIAGVEEMDVLEYPVRSSTSGDRDYAIKTMRAIYTNFCQHESLCPALLLCITQAMMAFLLDTRLSILLTRRYGRPQLGLFALSPIDMTTPTGLRTVIVSLAFTSPPPGTAKPSLWRSERMASNGMGVHSVHDAKTGGGLAIFLGPARFLNHSCGHENVSPDDDKESTSDLDGLYQDWYHVIDFSVKRGAIPVKYELLWKYSSDFFGIDCKCEGHGQRGRSRQTSTISAARARNLPPGK